MIDEAEHHGIEPEPRARPCPSAIDGMLHIYRIVSGIALIDFERSIKGELLDLVRQHGGSTHIMDTSPFNRRYTSHMRRYAACTRVSNRYTCGHFVKAVTYSLSAPLK